MAQFQINRPIRTTEPKITVDNQLRPGKHRFRLEVIDSADLRSEPSDVVVTVDPLRPSRPVVRDPRIDPTPGLTDREPFRPRRRRPLNT